MSELDEQFARRLRHLVNELPTHAVPDLPAIRTSALARLPRVAGAALAAVVVVAAVGAGLLVSGRLPGGNGITANNGDFHGGGISFHYPTDWKAYPGSAYGSFFSAFAIMGTVDLGECSRQGGLDLNCAYGRQLAPGELRLVVGSGGRPGFSLLDLKPASGWQLFVDGLPAVVESSGPNTADASDLTLTWTIARPGMVDNFYSLTASLRGPGLEAMRAQLDALVASIRYDEPPTPLPTGTAEAAAAAQAAEHALDALDRSSREYGSDWYGCFSRRPGASQASIVTGGPGNPGSPLPAPVSLTCSTSVAATELQLWKLTLDATWPAGITYPAGSYQERLFLTADGEQVGGNYGELPADSPFSATFPTAAPVSRPVSLEPGRPAVVVDPGATTYLTPDQAGDSLSSMAVGTRLFVVSGPQTAGGIDWYLVQWPPTRSYAPVLGWLPAKVDNRPQAQTVAPVCPASPTLPELVAMAWGERLLCYGAEPITLSRVMVGEHAPDLEVNGQPVWLAEDSSLRLYDDQGPTGVGGWMQLHVDPASALNLPTGTLLEITGHFDDPAATGCSRAFVGAEASSLVPEDAGAQVLRCRENFVVTGFRVSP